MNPLKKAIFWLLAILPLGSISYAADYELHVETPDSGDIISQFEESFSEETLPQKYYYYMDKHGIITLEDLRAERNYRHFLQMLLEFEKDSQYGVTASGGAISIGGTQ